MFLLEQFPLSRCSLVALFDNPIQNILMVDPQHPLVDLLRRDDRYHFDAYIFVFDALRYGQEKLGFGIPSDELSETEEDDNFGREEPEHHVSGQQLCEAIRLYALEQYGLMAKNVLNHWGVTSTGDFGEIVFSLIEIGQMRKTPQDRREDFDNVYDFSEALCEGFEICRSDPTEERSS